ncbi:DUF4446 family protein [Gorillibacterium massiliense]|uniref:DUF4446 family protein n=1 Tax=Gorillibacterium massiliense TaxID=1280390 RepID=UPI0004B50479|nr:DUF4446 family protein [Gorillibacterium massiliense]
MGTDFEIDPQVYFVAGTALFLLSLVLFLILSIRLSKMNKRYKKMMNGRSGADIEEVLGSVQETLHTLNDRTERNEQAARDIRSELKERKSKVEVIRYNAFGQRGSDMSFSIAILNDYLDGVVLTGIHSREQTFMYAKPLEKGDSSYNLSPEEKEVVEKAAGSSRKERQTTSVG